jgi:hypothetical protein
MNNDQSNTTTIVKRDNPYKTPTKPELKKPGRIRVWRFDDPSTWIRRDQERHK